MIYLIGYLIVLVVLLIALKGWGDSMEAIDERELQVLRNASRNV